MDGEEDGQIPSNRGRAGGGRRGRAGEAANAGVFLGTCSGRKGRTGRMVERSVLPKAIRIHNRVTGHKDTPKNVPSKGVLHSNVPLASNGSV